MDQLSLTRVSRRLNSYFEANDKCKLTQSNEDRGGSRFRAFIRTRSRLIKTT